MSAGRRTRARTFFGDARRGGPAGRLGLRRASVRLCGKPGGGRVAGASVGWPKQPATETGRGRYTPRSDKRGVARPGSNHGRRLLANTQVRKVAGARAGGCSVGAQKFETPNCRPGQRSPRPRAGPRSGRAPGTCNCVTGLQLRSGAARSHEPHGLGWCLKSAKSAGVPPARARAGGASRDRLAALESLRAWLGIVADAPLGRFVTPEWRASPIHDTAARSEEFQGQRETRAPRGRDVSIGWASGRVSLYSET